MDHQDIAPEETEYTTDGLLDFSDDIITVLVGPEQEKFIVHAKQLQKSPYFRNAMKETWLVDGTISLPVDDPKIIRFYLHFLYASEVPETSFPGLAALYVYGERVVDLRFKDTIIKTIISMSRHSGKDGQCYWPVTDAVDCIYAGTLSGSPGRRLLVDIFACHGGTHWIGDHEYDADFLRDLVLRRMHENEGMKAVTDDEIVAERYLEEPQALSQIQSQQHANLPNTAEVNSLYESENQLHRRLSPDSRTALAAYDERLTLQEVVRASMVRRW
ncbi:uncharacterized protein RCC_09048 [Ramularia collo-cygni]|uniref:BTB domain-containing protein n=1 Tax=Ramularia collo-cygni TaxID=112498 RepID=A0A2D3V1R1_9PEZI|nr:uncharacterized protein RCC_09048 [Ramularia collo-cygni]CZT23336.1 uncharacterized protein RCC_09048 [Ramularia collo-cygni]